MAVIKSFFIAFSIYSKIPVPQFAWEEEDMRYMICFFPWVGAMIGVCVWLWGQLAAAYEVGTLCYAAVGTAIPLLITGGFHVDGFMDTMDAFHSYQPREKKLEILKDAHIGAFAVIMLAVCGLMYLGAFSEIRTDVLLRMVGAGFFLSRVLSGIGVVTFPSAKKEGLLYLFANSAHEKVVKAVLYLEGVLCIIFMLGQSVLYGALLVVTALSIFAYYYVRTKRELGGITGDTAGYFVVLCESGMVIVAALIDVLWI